MKKQLFLIQCIAAAASILLLPAQSHAQQKTAKACEEEWKANKPAIQASGKRKKDFIIECRGGAAAIPAATGDAPVTAPAEGGVKTFKACAAEWTANKATLQAGGKKRKDFIAECRGIPTTTASATPDKPAAPASRDTPVVAQAGSPGPKTFRACVAEWITNKVTLQGGGKTRKDFIAECRGTTKTAANPDKPSAPMNADKPAAPMSADKPASSTAPAPARRDSASLQDTGSTIKNPRFSPTAPTGQFASEAEAKSRCPGEPVVWANTRSKVYHGPKSRRYGTTKRGVYICLKEASAAGFRAAKRKKRRAKTVAVAAAR